VACIALNHLLTVLDRRHRWHHFLSEEMQAQYLAQVLISSCAPVMRGPSTKAHVMQPTQHYGWALLLTAVPLQVCTVESPFDNLWFMVFPHLTFSFNLPRLRLVFRSSAGNRNLKWVLPFIRNDLVECSHLCAVTCREYSDHKRRLEKTV
jgi:hypothetical protein